MMGTCLGSGFFEVFTAICACLRAGLLGKLPLGTRLIEWQQSALNGLMTLESSAAANRSATRLSQLLSRDIDFGLNSHSAGRPTRSAILQQAAPRRQFVLANR